MHRITFVIRNHIQTLVLYWGVAEYTTHYAKKYQDDISPKILKKNSDTNASKLLVKLEEMLVISGCHQNNYPNMQIINVMNI